MSFLFFLNISILLSCCFSRFSIFRFLFSISSSLNLSFFIASSNIFNSFCSSCFLVSIACCISFSFFSFSASFSFFCFSCSLTWFSNSTFFCFNFSTFFSFFLFSSSSFSASSLACVSCAFLFSSCCISLFSSLNCLVSASSAWNFGLIVAFTYEFIPVSFLDRSYFIHTLEWFKKFLGVVLFNCKSLNLKSPPKLRLVLAIFTCVLTPNSFAVNVASVFFLKLASFSLYASTKPLVFEKVATDEIIVNNINVFFTIKFSFSFFIFNFVKTILHRKRVKKKTFLSWS